MIWEGAPNSSHHRVFQKEIKAVTTYWGGMGRGREIQGEGDMCVCVCVCVCVYDYDLHRSQHNIVKKLSSNKSVFFLKKCFFKKEVKGQL